VLLEDQRPRSNGYVFDAAYSKGFRVLWSSQSGHLEAVMLFIFQLWLFNSSCKPRASKIEVDRSAPVLPPLFNPTTLPRVYMMISPHIVNSMSPKLASALLSLNRGACV
jgi:hypothetical protein